MSLRARAEAARQAKEQALIENAQTFLEEDLPVLEDFLQSRLDLNITPTSNPFPVEDFLFGVVRRDEGGYYLCACQKCGQCGNPFPLFAFWSIESLGEQMKVQAPASCPACRGKRKPGFAMPTG